MNILNRRANFPTFTVVGSTIKTQNNPEGFQAIGQLWQEFLSGGAGQNISHRQNSDVVALYHAYEGDATAPYHLTIGVSVAKHSEMLDEGLSCVHVPSATYEVFSLANQTGMDSAQACFTLWQHIWQQADLKRSYSIDFEVHKPDGSVEVYIAVEQN